MWNKESGRTSPLPKYWPSLRKKILLRDRNECQEQVIDPHSDEQRKCREWATDVDHIDSPTDHRSANLRSLCSYHHDKKTAAQGGNAARDNKADKPGWRVRKKPPHPGLL